jgi:hypothetical protein
VSRPATTTAAALRILASEIRSPDDVPAMCLRDAANMIERQDAAIRQALVCAQAIWPRGKDCEHTQAREIFAALEGAI